MRPNLTYKQTEILFEQMPADQSKLFQEVLTTMLTTKIRIDQKLSTLTYLLSLPYPYDSTARSRIDRTILFKTIRAQTDPFQVLKLSILAHKCILSHIVPDVQLMIRDLHGVPMEEEEGEGLSHRGYMGQKLLLKYLGFLQRRALKDDGQDGNELEALERCYNLINLVKKGLSFVDTLMPMFRYYQKEHAFLIDFNVLLAEDLSDLYQQLSKNVHRLPNADQNAQIFKEVELIHEGMFIVFFNCYNASYVYRFHPKWIETEEVINKSVVMQKKKDGENKFERVLANNSMILNTPNCSQKNKINNSSIITMDSFDKNTKSLARTLKSIPFKIPQTTTTNKEEPFHIKLQSKKETQSIVSEQPSCEEWRDDVSHCSGEEGSHCSREEGSQTMHERISLLLELSSVIEQCEGNERGNCGDPFEELTLEV